MTEEPHSPPMHITVGRTTKNVVMDFGRPLQQVYLSPTEVTTIVEALLRMQRELVINKEYGEL